MKTPEDIKRRKDGRIKGVQAVAETSSEISFSWKPESVKMETESDENPGNGDISAGCLKIQRLQGFSACGS